MIRRNWQITLSPWEIQHISHSIGQADKILVKYGKLEQNNKLFGHI